MTGGFHMKQDADGYDGTPQELERAEQQYYDDLACLELGLQALKLAKSWLEESGYCLPRLSEDIGQIKLAIGLLRGRST